MFFALYGSEKKWQREIANLCLACAVAIKVYPLLIALFFIKDRRWVDMIKTVLYSLFLLFIPFLFIDGGFANIKSIWNNFSHFNSGEGRNLELANVGFDGFASKIGLGLFGSNLIYSLLSKVLRFGTIVMTIIVFALSKNSKKTLQIVLIAILTYALFQGVAYAYVMVSVIVPIVIFVVNYGNLSYTDKWFYGICFLICSLQVYIVNLFYFPTQIAMICMLFKSYVDLLLERKQQKNKGNLID